MMTISEHFLSLHEKGTKIAYNTIKIKENEETLKTLEVKLKNQNINIISDILGANSINVIGMTMIKEDEKDTYKYVIFVNMEKPLDINILVNKIATMDNVKSAIFTDKYEL